MVFEDDLKQAVINELGRLEVQSLQYYPKDRREIISILYKNGSIDDHTIERALEPAVILRARKDYTRLVRGNDYADHVGRPEVLAYAIKKGEFNWLELRKIKFDDGENPKIFAERYGFKNLLSRLREELLNPRPLPKFESGLDSDCFDLCCCLDC